MYDSIPSQVGSCPTSFHHLYSTMKSALVGITQTANTNNSTKAITIRMCEGRISNNS